MQHRQEFTMRSHTDDTQASATSFNYSVFKVLSILIVASGHWFIDSSIPFWIPATIGLFIFAFSSALFTTRIYGPSVDVGAFWRKKLQRLLVRYWFLLACLAVLLAARGAPVLHWHSLVHVFGLSGVLNVFGVNHSALGAGLWFFTLLLLFYVSYPGLVRLFARSGNDFLLPLIATMVFVLLDQQVNVGFALWRTTLGFILGVFVGLYGTRVPPMLSLTLTVGALIVMLGLNIGLHYNEANSVLLTLACITTNLWLMTGRVPQWRPLRVLAKLENCLLEIFVIHTYLFVHPTHNAAVDFCLSFALIIGAAWFLNLAASRLVAFLFSPRVKPTAASATRAESPAAQPELNRVTEH
jgi:hypothetical protein